MQNFSLEEISYDEIKTAWDSGKAYVDNLFQISCYNSLAIEESHRRLVTQIDRPLANLHIREFFHRAENVERPERYKKFLLTAFKMTAAIEQNESRHAIKPKTLMDPDYPTLYKIECLRALAVYRSRGRSDVIDLPIIDPLAHILSLPKLAA